ncbi:LapB repeat-containing protein [Listeria monocytogenes]|nr:LapB repeat-containing protein [Listeria monocytogenes]
MKLSKIFTIIALSATVTSSLPIPTVNAESTTVNETKSESQLLATDLKETKTEEAKETPKEKTTANNLKNQLVQAGTKTYNDYFPDNNLAKAVAEKMNKNVDESVTVEELAKITKLDARSQGIEDSTGIEYLTGLETLYLDDNQLKSIDVSKNLNLKELACSNNPLANIDVSKNLALEELTCDNNELKNIDIDQNLALIELSCENNQLTNLDTTQNLALEILYCDDNQLTNLDVRKNVNLLILSCNNNQLTNLAVGETILDVSCNNNQLKDISSLPDYLTAENGEYQAMDQTLVGPIQTTQNNTLVYAVPTDLLDKDGNIVSIIKPENGGVYDAATRTITWENLPDSGEVSYTFESNDYGVFSGRVTVPYTGKETVSISSDDEISYKEGTTKTEEAFLTDIHASATPATETITSNFADVVDLQTPGKYVVKLSVAESDITKDVIVYVTEEPSKDNPVAPVPPKDPDNKVADNDQNTEKPQVKVDEKTLPKTGDITSLSLSLAGIICLSFGILFFIKRKKKTV